MKFDFFVAGRARNKERLEEVLRVIRRCDKTAWCFIEKSYLHGNNVAINMEGGGDMAAKQLETLDLQDELIKQIFDDDLKAERSADNFVLVLPAGISGHIEAGIAFGLGKRCYAIGEPEKTESLYHIFDRIFANINEFEQFLKEQK
ncbi:MAG: hypothetical protein LBQ11_00200 [Candidatus Nomurabacteria bacterium]|jgi:hypothetical protein|nr:hypothetical protein [Candidatus Nomurabacteria bacterium]